MSTISQPSPAIPKPRQLPAELFVRNMWAGLGIVVIWLAVLFDAAIALLTRLTTSRGIRA